MPHRLLILLCLAGLVGCRPSQPGDSSTRTDSLPARDERPVLRFGVISRYNPILMYRLYQPLVDYLSAHTPYRFELTLGKTYKDAVQYLEQGRTDIAYLGGVTYLMAREQYGALPLVKPLNPDGEPYYRSAFVVREDSPIQQLSDLRGKSLALGSGYSTSGNLVPRLELHRAGLDLASLERFAYLPHEEQVAKQVLAGQYDAGALKDVVAHHYARRGLRIIHTSDPIPSVPLTVRADLPDSVARALVEALLDLNASDLPGPAGWSAWEAEYRHGFVLAADADYAPLRQTLNTIPGGCAQGCHQERKF